MHRSRALASCSLAMLMDAHVTAFAILDFLFFPFSLQCINTPSISLFVNLTSKLSQNNPMATNSQENQSHGLSDDDDDDEFSYLMFRPEKGGLWDLSHNLSLKFQLLQALTFLLLFFDICILEESGG